MSENAVAVYTDVEMQRPADFKSGFQLLPVEQQEVVLAEYSARRTHFRKWLLSQLKEGIHYGSRLVAKQGTTIKVMCRFTFKVNTDHSTHDNGFPSHLFIRLVRFILLTS